MRKSSIKLQREVLELRGEFGGDDSQTVVGEKQPNICVPVIQMAESRVESQ